MFVFRIHGRFGQGVETAAKILCKAGFLSGFESQAIISQGMERRGSYIISYVKMDKVPITSKDLSGSPDFLLIFDKTLVKESLTNIKKGSAIIIDSERFDIAAVRNARARAYFVKATDIALTNIKKPVPNTVMIGALLRYFNRLSMKGVKAVIEQDLDLPKENAAALEEGYRSVK